MGILIFIGKQMFLLLLKLQPGCSVTTLVDLSTPGGSITILMVVVFWCESMPGLTALPPVVMVVCSSNVLPSKRGFHLGRRGKSSQLFFFFFGYLPPTTFQMLETGKEEGLSMHSDLQIVLLYRICVSIRSAVCFFHPYLKCARCQVVNHTACQRPKVFAHTNKGKCMHVWDRWCLGRTSLFFFFF